ncbi:MAG: GAF domain-containing protein, partial [Haliea sp.]
LMLAVEELRRLTGFDRVMAYRFRHDESGDVVAESCDAALEPFVGRRYPASDIPAQARRLYIINTLRLIADVGAPPVPVLAAPQADAPLDMSHGVLRSVSPVHIEYLTNMGVGASMSVSIVIGGKLWGMLACHHMQPRRLAYTVRMACDMLSQILASNLQGLLARDRAAQADAAASLRSRLVEKVLHADDVLLGVSSEAAALCEGFDAHAAVVSYGARMEVFGDLTLTAGQAVIDWLNEGTVVAGRMIYRDTLPAPLPAQLDVWCGLLALPFGAETPGWLVLLRKEQIETVLWGGKPEKEYKAGPLGPRLTPRGSFALWREIVRGKAVPWNELHLESAQKLLDELVRADAAHMVEINRARNQLMAMLGHDLRDPLQSISNTALLMEKRGGDGKLTQRLQSSSSRMQRLVGQVMDMSRLQSGALTFDLQPVDLVPLLMQLVGEMRAAHPRMEVLVEAPAALMADADADRMSQVISNLLSNASHHGAPGQPVRVRLAEDAGTVLLDISNVGEAIAPDLAATLFLPFKRNAGRSATNRNGLGLGLYIARQVMAGHGGTLAYRYDAPWVVFSATFPTRQPLSAAV